MSPHEELFRRLLDESSALLASPESAGIAMPDDEMHREIIVPLLPAMLADAAIRRHWNEQVASGFVARLARHLAGEVPAPRWLPGDFEIHVSASFAAGPDAKALADTLLSEDSLRDLTAELMNQFLDALWPSLAPTLFAPPATEPAVETVPSSESGKIPELLKIPEIETSPTAPIETPETQSIEVVPIPAEPEPAADMESRMSLPHALQTSPDGAPLKTMEPISHSVPDSPDWAGRAVSSADAVGLLKSGMRVFVHGACATPTPLLEAMVRRNDLENVRLYHLHLAGPTPFTEPEYSDRFHSISFFAGAAQRKPIDEARADFIPIFLSDIPGLFHSGQVPLDVALLQLSPPDAHGWCSLGTSVDAARAAADTAKIIIAEINEQMPRTHGAAHVRFERVAAFVHTDRPLSEHAPEPGTEIHGHIGQFIADMVEDGSVLQLGIGAIPDAVLARLGEKRDLGIHTEMFSDGVVDLYATGAITNRLKAIHPNRIVTSFVNGTRRLFDFVRDNPAVEFHPCDRTNDTQLLRKLDKLVAINSAIEIDLTGQVCADSIGHRIFSGIGGQMDFIRGAALSRGGKPIIALPSTAVGGKVSRIVPVLKPGAGVVTTRGHVHWVVTEFGAVNLHGMTLRERGEALISIAHPDFRAELARDFATIRRVEITNG